MKWINVFIIILSLVVISVIAVAHSENNTSINDSDDWLAEMKEHYEQIHGDDFEEHHKQMHGDNWEEHIAGCHKAMHGSSGMMGHM